MTFDIIDMEEEDLLALSTVQMRLLRTAQQEKDDLTYELERDKQTFYNIVVADGMLNSGIYAAKCYELDEEYEQKVAVLKDNLIYNMSRNVPTGDDWDTCVVDDSDVGYIVDYSLSYLDRYQIVRNYYMSISDPAERIVLYTADTTAKDYLGQYYNTLYNVFSQYI